MEIYAHRGYSGKYPENTVAAFRAAAELPIAGIECDLHLTKDNEIVVIHDEKVDRTSNGEGYVKDLTLAQLKELDFGSWFSDEWRNERIPTLDEVFDIFENTNHQLNLELKTDIFPYEPLVEKVLDVVVKRGFTERVVISSFNHEDVQTVCQKKSVEAAILTVKTYVDAYEHAGNIGTDRLHISLLSDFDKMVPDILAKGGYIYVYTVNDIEHAQRLKPLGVHGIFTDYPERMLEFFGDNEK